MVNSQKLDYEILEGLESVSIDTSKLEKNIRVKKAFLVLKVKCVSENATFNVNFYVNNQKLKTTDIVSGLSTSDGDNKVYLNITDEIQYLISNNITSGFLKFEGESGHAIELEESEEDSKVRYLMPSSFEENATKHSVRVSPNCEAKVNLSSGELEVLYQDLNLNCSAISLPVSHSYNSNGALDIDNENIKNLYGNNFNLSIIEYLSEVEDEEGNKTGEYIHIDANGKREKITEKFYYLDDDDSKVYIDRNDTNLQMDVNGDLKYMLSSESGNIIKEVKSVLSTPTGLTLVTSKKDIKGAELTSIEPDELINIREQVKNLELSKENIENTIENSKKQLLILALSKYALKKQIEISNLTIKEKEPKEGEPKEGTTVNNSVSPQSEDETSTDYSDDILNVNKEIYQNVKSVNDINSILKSEIGDDGYLRLQEILETNHEDFMLSHYFEELKVGGDSVVVSNKDLYSSEMQIENMLTSLETYYSQLQSTNDSLKKLYNEKANYERQVPSYYLYNDDIIYGFSPIIIEKEEVLETSTTGQEVDIITPKQKEIKTTYTTIPCVFRLNYIADNSENAIIINYEAKSNKIESIVDSKNYITIFSYNENDLLASIIDQNENETKFFYDDNKNLVEIVGMGNKKTSFVYKNNSLIGIISPNGLGARFTYNNGKVVSIQNLSNLEKVENAQSVMKCEEVTKQNIDSLLGSRIVKFSYKNPNSTVLTSLKKENNNDKVLKTLVYVFDEAGRAVSIYQNEFNEEDASASSPKVVSFAYASKEKRETISPLIYSKNYLQDTCFTNNEYVTEEAVSNFLGNSLLEGDDLYLGDDIYLETYLKHKSFHSFDSESAELKDYVEVDSQVLSEINDEGSLVLSGFAKANSLFVVNLDNTESDISDFSTYLQNRKFELRAEVTYTDGSMTSFSKNFDYGNTDWQFASVLVPIDKNKEVSKIKCYFDYSNNLVDTPVYFTDLMLQEAKVDTQIYADKKLIQSFSNMSKWRSEYKYNADDKLTKILLFDKTKEGQADYMPLETKYSYNKNGKVYKVTDYNGIVTENEFNDNGVIVKTKKYHKDNPAEIIFSEENLDENGKVLSSVNSLGKTVITYTYDEERVESTTDCFGNITSYGYDEAGNTIQMTSTENGVSNTNTYGYTLDFLTSVSHNNFDISYDYDGEGRVSKIKIDEADYLTLNYDDMSNSSVATYKNNESFKSVKNIDGNVTEVLYSAPNEPDYTPLLQNVYDTHGSLIRTNDLVTNSSTKYTFDKFGNTAKTETTQHGISVEKNTDYDAHGNVTFNEYTFGDAGTGEGYGYSYEFDTMSPDNALRGVILPTSALESITRDNLGRTKEITLNQSMDSEIKMTRLFHYLKSGNHTSNQVSSIWFGDNGKYYDNLRYKYDDKGNILEVKENGVVIARYQYDGLSRLVREDNKQLLKTTTYEYVAGGNISCKTEYAFTLVSNLDEKTPTVVIPYTYASSGNRDRLMSYDGESFTYDEIGNPTKYRDVVLTWEKGRQLKKYGNIEYSYNAQGIRTKKVNGNAITEYYLDGSQILAQKDIVVAGDNTQIETTMHFVYGLDGISGFTINNQNYYYKKNLQGDIIGIYDNNLNLIVKYDYDSWGEHKIYYLDNTNFVDFDLESTYTNTSNTNLYIALKNPFRYRGYYYDSETGLYYLNSRYYDSEIGRFINADDISVLDITNIALNGINLYAYCLNNPVNEVDESGYFLFWLFVTAIVVGAAVSAGTEIVSQAIEYGWDNINWGQVAWAGLMGGVSGALSVTGLGVVGMTIAGGVVGFVTAVGDNLIGGSDFTDWRTWLDIGLSTGLGAVFGYIGGAGATNGKELDKAIKASSQFRKAATSYDKVLTKIANGGYRTLAGAAGARALTRSTLQKTWQSVVIKSAWSDFGAGLKYSAYQSIIDIVSAWFNGSR